MGRWGTTARALLLALALNVAAIPAVAVPGDHASAPTAAAAEGELQAIDLRVALSRLLGEHAYLLMEAMRSSTVGDAERDAVESALDENSAGLTEAIRTVYGDEAATAFAGLWDRHVVLLLDYADATRSGDAEGRSAAEQGLDDYASELAHALDMLNPALEPHDEEAALQLHLDQVRSFADADYAQAYAAHREAFLHMFRLGDHLALGIARQFPDRFTGGAVAFSPRSDLRLALDRLLGEHMILAASAMRAGVTDAADFDAAAGSLDENSTDLMAAIASVYGDEAGEAFGEVWTEHIAAYLDFVHALGSGDEQARADALASLHSYHDRIASFLTSANPELDGDAVADLIRRHVQALITQAEATAAGDAERAIAATRDGYDGTFEVGAALADAIARQFPDRFKDLKELAPTTTGVTAEPDTGGIPLTVLVILAIGSVLVLIHPKTEERRRVTRRRR
jgi:hypothetical protein